MFFKMNNENINYDFLFNSKSKYVDMPFGIVNVVPMTSHAHILVIGDK